MKTRITLKQILLEEAEATYTVTKKLFYKVADSDLSWKPATGTNWMTVGQLLMHCANFGCGKAIQGFVKGDWDLPEGAKPEDLDATQHVPLRRRCLVSRASSRHWTSWRVTGVLHCAVSVRWKKLTCWQRDSLRHGADQKSRCSNTFCYDRASRAA